MYSLHLNDLSPKSKLNAFYQLILRHYRIALDISRLVSLSQWGVITGPGHRGVLWWAGRVTAPSPTAPPNVGNFSANRVLMKLFRSSNIEIIAECRNHFVVELPSVQLAKRFKKFSDMICNMIA